MRNFLSIIIDWIIFISSCIPIFIMIFLNNLEKFSCTDIKNTYNLNRWFWITIFIISIVSIVILLLWIKNIKCTPKLRKDNFKRIKKVEPIDSEIINYFVTFIIPVLSLNPKSTPSIILNLILLIIEGIYLVSNRTVYYNVFFIMLGYHIYKFELNDELDILITKKTYADINLEDGINVFQVSTTDIYYS